MPPDPMASDSKAANVYSHTSTGPKNVLVAAAEEIVKVLTTNGILLLFYKLAIYTFSTKR